MNIEDVILAIIKDTGLSRKEILKMIDFQRYKSNKIISDKKALIIIARNLCVDL